MLISFFFSHTIAKYFFLFSFTVFPESICSILARFGSIILKDSSRCLSKSFKFGNSSKESIKFGCNVFDEQNREIKELAYLQGKTNIS